MKEDDYSGKSRGQHCGKLLGDQISVEDPDGDCG